MKRLKDVMNTVDALTGKRGRQTKAIDGVSEWAAAVQEFLTRYDLYGSSELGTLVEKCGDAKFDLTGIIYNGRPLISSSKAFKKTDLPDLVEVVLNGVESVRRYLIDPSLQETHLKQAVLNVRVDYERLQSEINRIIAED